MTVAQSASVKVSAPFPKAELVEFLATVPEAAEIAVTVHQGGSQRDPYPVGYSFTAKWESTNQN